MDFPYYRIWGLLVADFGLSPSEAWNTTTFEFLLLRDIKYGEPQEQARQATLTRNEAQSLRAELEAEIAKERRNGTR